MIRLSPPEISILPLFPKLQPGEEAFVKSSLCTEINGQLSVWAGSRLEVYRGVAIRAAEKEAGRGVWLGVPTTPAQGHPLEQAPVQRAQVVIQARTLARGRGEAHLETSSGTPSRWESLCGHR